MDWRGKMDGRVREIGFQIWKEGNGKECCFPLQARWMEKEISGKIIG